MPSKTIYFSRARTALNYGLQSLDIDDQDIILVPDFICDTIFQPINQNSLRFLTYKLTDDLSPIWSKLDSLVTNNTKAIVMVHYFGQPQDINKFLNFCKKHNLYLIEDNAHGHSGIFEGKELGTFGDIGTFSFFPGKNLGAFGDGGAIITNSKKIYENCLRLRNHGSTKKYDHKFPGRNSRLDTIQAAVLNIKLKTYKNTVKKRNFLANYYLKNYYASISDYNKVIEIDPDNPKISDAYYNRGLSKEKIGDRKGACSDWRKASELGDEDAAKWVRDQCQ